MQIVLITPAPAGSRAGNRATAERWAELLEQDGHQVCIVTEYNPDLPCDLLIALHAWRSHDAVQQFRMDYPTKPLVIALTGTDIYDHQYRFPQETAYSMEQADCLICLHRQVDQDIPDQFRQKLITVLQSAALSSRETGSRGEGFQICVIGHLRDEKDSLRAALAARLLPANSGIRVLNAGKAHTAEWENRARTEQETNPRFRWMGEIGRDETRRLMQDSDVMVISSIMEGGANVVSEACRMGLPILASDIPGNTGLLGPAYPGYFRTGDEKDLAALMLKAEQNPQFVRELEAAVAKLASDFSPENEKASLAAAVTMATTQRSELTRSG
ncbi:selenoneine biosynthesis selenosugar synthase SenB [Marinobacter sp. CHS3-4]|uniref:selenoneine biosynthesis selenosugar synthase SenB n=1 Tax=Marinobacter sp. CHS3-4 TaxID=3045174 RepID=UPI0024B5204E|nr:selenoneine biosynthesis selenosugar synthase SenB [Marinobacter sp. CHS3-4]MDI9245409.1 selenoneine biosynthesis selenosugar synthase SenB [Marinobacter sp. CHS3-4]